MISPFVTADTVMQLKTTIIGKVCKNKCNGTGAILENYTFTDCVCVKEFQSQLKYVAANIPRKYWNFDFRNLLKKFVEENSQALSLVKNYSIKISEMVTEGIGLYICGDCGLAKSSLGCYILKEAIKKDITCFNIRMSQLTKLIVEDNYKGAGYSRQVEWIRDKVSLLMIDEFEKDYKIDNPSTYSGSIINEFFSNAYDNKKALIITSNKPKSMLQGVHAENIIDRIEELAEVVLTGTSFRGQKEAITKIMS